jgi:hypothetical protein
MPSILQRVAESQERARFVKVAEAMINKHGYCLQFSVKNETYYLTREDLNNILSDESVSIPVYVLRKKT